MQHKHTLLLFGVFLLSSLGLHAQQLKGKVYDASTREPLAFCTVSLLKADSTLLTGTVTDEQGAFNLTIPQEKPLLLRISFVGYHTYRQTLRNTAEQLPDSLFLQPVSETLEDMVVVGKLPLIEQKMDKLVVNVESMLSIQGEDAIALLRKVPGVSIDKDGNIKRNGKEVSIWIDGRPSYLSGEDLQALLKGTAAETIEKVEVIAHPSAKYDAAGEAGIINLKMKRSRLEGFNGNIAASYTSQPYKQYYFQQGNGSAMLSYRSSISNSVLNVSGGGYDNFSVVTSTNSVPDTQLQQKEYSLTNNLGYYTSVRFSNDFFINKSNTLGFIFSYNGGEGKKPQLDYHSEIMIADSVAQRGNIEEENFDNRYNYTANLNYTLIFNEEKSSEITFNADYVSSNNYGEQDKLYSYMQGNDETPFSYKLYNKHTRNRMNVYSGKADFQHALSPNYFLEAGAKYAHTTTLYDNQQWLISSPTPPEAGNPDKTQLRYTEQIGALYVTFSAKLNNQWTIKGGLRGEYTDVLGTWGDTATTQRYFNVFPTVFVGYTPNEKHRLSFSYTSRINRPSYWQLNPIANTQGSEESYLYGNPAIKPSLSHNLQLDYGWGYHVNLSAGYSYANNVPTAVLFKLEGLTKHYRWENFATSQNGYLSVSLSELPIVKNWLTTTAIISGMLTVFDETISNPLQQITPLSIYGYAYGSLNLQLPKRFRIELSGWGASPAVWAYSRQNWVGSMDLSVKKNFLKDDRLSVTLTVADVFNSGKTTLVQKISGNNSIYTQEFRWSSTAARVSLSYRFGNNGQPTKRRNVGNVEELNRNTESSKHP